MFRKILIQYIGENSCDRIGLGFGYLSGLLLLNLSLWGII